MSIQNGTPIAREESIIRGDKYRFTVLTERMIRMEYSETGVFEDRKTTVILNRLFPTPEFQVEEGPDYLKIFTKYFIVEYDKKPFSHQGLSVRLLRNQLVRKQETWFYGDTAFLDQGNLKGTIKELGGMQDERPELPNGLLSSAGFSVIDDSESSIIDDEGWVIPREQKCDDVYFLAYGRNYLDCLKTFFYMSGKQPMLPRHALGNWWSRYYSYTADEYLGLMERFEKEGYPFSVAVLDMGWHWINIDEKYGRGWNGYSWNTDLFPDPAGFLKKLKDKGMAVSLNLHPADGVRAHEDAYREFAEEMGVDPDSGRPVNFDVTSKKFWKAYFKYLHHPNEEMGVDFWWMDWQQGKYADRKGLDPLWLVNQYHYQDNGRDGKRAMAFSRYGGLGSHRYPVGFSGSTHMSWNALDYQPWFTSAASNVGYGWWSHDIGGHRQGVHDDELSTRWVQFGVFSPIMRLHSGNTVFSGKEPWKYCTDAQNAMRLFLRMRHRMLPYTYTMNMRAWRDDRPIIEPLYYSYPFKKEAYEMPNEYFFGNQLLVNPITSKNDYEVQAGCVTTWLPEGTWFDIFTGMVYNGGRVLKMYRTLETIPVLGKAGGILPLEADCEISTHTDNPKAMELYVFPGASGNFELYEDDGNSMDYLEGVSAVTNYCLDWEKKEFVIEPAQGNTELIPESRSYTVDFFGLAEDAVCGVSVDGISVDYVTEYDADRHILKVVLGEYSVASRIVVVLKPEAEIIRNNIAYYSFDAINRANIQLLPKEDLYAHAMSGKATIDIISEINALNVPEAMKNVMFEIVTAN